MGLDSLVDTKEQESSAGSDEDESSRNREPTKEELEERYHKVIGSPPYVKAFDEDRWEEIKEVIKDEYDYSVNEILHMPAEKRYNKLHQATQLVGKKNQEEQTTTQQEIRCKATGELCEGSHVQIQGEYFSVQATAGQVAVALENRKGTEVSYRDWHEDS